MVGWIYPIDKTLKSLWIRNKHPCNLCEDFSLWNSFLSIEVKWSKEVNERLSAKLPGKDKSCQMQIRSRDQEHNASSSSFRLFIQKHGRENF